MAEIKVKHIGNKYYRVIVKDDTNATTHTVTVTGDYYKKVTGGKVSYDTLLQASFAFLLQREPKETILKEFDLSKIEDYFPEYKTEVKKFF